MFTVLSTLRKHCPLCKQFPATELYFYRIFFRHGRFKRVGKCWAFVSGLTSDISEICAAFLIRVTVHFLSEHLLSVFLISLSQAIALFHVLSNYNRMSSFLFSINFKSRHLNSSLYQISRARMYTSEISIVLSNWNIQFCDLKIYKSNLRTLKG